MNSPWQFVKNFWLKPWSTLFGLVLGAMLVLWSPGWLGPIISAWDSLNPVVEPVSARIVERERDAVLLHIFADKIRGEECRILRIYGYGVAPD